MPAVGQLLVRPGSARLRKALQGAGLERGDGQKVGWRALLGSDPPTPPQLVLGPQRWREDTEHRAWPGSCYCASNKKLLEKGQRTE